MFGFIKKLLGTAPEAKAEAAPYKVEAPAKVESTPESVTPQVTDAVTSAAPVADFPVEKPKKKAAPKKATAEKKPVPKITGGKRGRKPKAK